MHTCPHCHEEMHEKAIKCIKCGHYISDPVKAGDLTETPLSPNISVLDLDPQIKEKFASVWYFPENHPTAFLYNLIFFQFSLNWIIEPTLEYERKMEKAGLINKISGVSEGMGSLYGGFLVIFVWGLCLGLCFMLPLIIITNGRILSGPLSWIFLVFGLLGLYLADKVATVRLEVFRAIRKAERQVSPPDNFN
jgi:hypothetical protein